MGRRKEKEKYSREGNATEMEGLWEREREIMDDESNGWIWPRLLAISSVDCHPRIFLIVVVVVPAVVVVVCLRSLVPIDVPLLSLSYFYVSRIFAQLAVLVFEVKEECP